MGTKSESLMRRLRSARIEQGLSQAVVASKLGVTQPIISHWENGNAEATPKQLAKLKKLLGVDDSPENNPPQDNRGFSDWLTAARTKAELSVAELAERSGVSIPHIYNIEAGRSTNPRDETRAKLERALNTRVSRDVREEVTNQQQIEGLGELTDFDPHTEADRPPRPGVYVFYDISDRPIYVGKSQNIRRVGQHHEKFWFKAPIVNSAAYVEVKDAKLRGQIEQVLIKFLKSNAVLNKQYVDRD